MKRSRLLASASFIAFIACSVPAAQAQDVQPETVVVTGSRLTNGSNTPTPVTAVSSQQLSTTAPNNIAEAVSDLPAFAGSANANRTTGGSSSGTAGQSLLNLRGLGTQRNLVLLDGQRMIASNASGSTDINLIPEALVRSVEIVTGGASAAYGSDAVSGVVNFILDTKFEGFKGELQGGLSTFADSDSYKANATWGGNFLGGRLHVVASAEVFYQNPIDWFSDGGRTWEVNPGGLITNPVSGAHPTEFILHNVRTANADYGGLITNTILKGTQFLPDGTPVQHDYGTLTTSTFQIGGTNAIVPRQPLNPRQRRANFFTHADYDLDDDTTISLEALLAWSDNVIEQYPNYMFGQYAYTIFSGNPYIPASIQTVMTNNNIASFTLGKSMADQSLEQENAMHQLQRYHAGIKGRLWGDWTYQANYLHSISTQDEHENYIPNMHNSYAAADAVVNPQSGQIVCRSQYYNGAGVFMPGGTGLDPGCVPTNLFGGGFGAGTGPLTEAGQNYITGSSIKWLLLTQDIFDVSMAGELPADLSLPAGPISAATGFSYRSEDSNQRSDAVSQQTISCTGLRGCPAALAGRGGAYLTFDPVPFSGQYSVAEGFVELGIPVLKDFTLAKSLDVNLAAREAGYSNSGEVLSWKAGFTWRPIDDVLVRFTQSRDIRAPNILELFNPRSITSANVIYQGNTVSQTAYAHGNPALLPEKALTTTAGIVYTPSWLEGFNFSIDYYKIYVRDAIDQLGAQGTVNQCAAGATFACNLITVSSNGSLVVDSPELNLDDLDVKGVDLEASYNTGLFDGDLALRALANYVGRYESAVVGNAPVNGLDTKDARVPWHINLAGTFTQGPFALTIQERYIGEGHYDATLTTGIGINVNSTPHVYYTDMTLEYQFAAYGAPMTGYLNVTNLWNQNPPLVPSQSTFEQPTNGQLYDTMGRYFTMGIRFKM